MKYGIYMLHLLWTCLLGCGQPVEHKEVTVPEPPPEIVIYDEPLVPDVTLPEMRLTKNFKYDKYTLADKYEYNKKERSFKWNRIKQYLLYIENMQKTDRQWVVIQNYKNKNQEAPAVFNFKRNEYDLVCDTLMVEKFQSAPLYFPDDTLNAIIYARDGNIAEFKDSVGTFLRIRPVGKEEDWFIPSRYVHFLKPGIKFRYAVFIDRGDQNIATLKHISRAHWDILSMNPATTGQYLPPHAKETPLGGFIIQEKKEKMYFWKDGTREIGGFAPFASRFTCGAYIHGVPVNLPAKDPIEYSWSLGTIPRSHMCVRNATSHAQFVYKTMPVWETLVIVLE